MLTRCRSAVVTVGALHAGHGQQRDSGARPRLELSVRALEPEVRASCCASASRPWPAQQAASFGVRGRRCDWRAGYAGAGQRRAARPTCAARGGCPMARAEPGASRNGAALTGQRGLRLHAGAGPRLLLSGGQRWHRAAAGACMVHNPGYDFNDALIEPAAAFWTQLRGLPATRRPAPATLTPRDHHDTHRHHRRRHHRRHHRLRAGPARL